MNIIAFFTNGGIPATGLSATIDIWTIDGSSIVSGAAMTEIAGGFYTYDFSTYDEQEDYTIRSDGSNTLSGNDRYKFSSNETAGVGKLLKVQVNKWEIIGNQLIIYDDDGTTAIVTLDLQDAAGNPASRNVMKRIPV